MESLFFLLIFFSSFLFLIPSNSLSSPKNNHSVGVALFIFGDSLFDAGNNNYIKNTTARANFWPYGETFFNHPTGRFSDGRLIPDFIAENLKLPLILPYLQPGNHHFNNGVNFASAGAGALVETHQGKVIDLNTQLSHFKNVKKQLRQKLGNTKTKELLSKAIYLFSIGTNDYADPLLKNSSLLHHYTNKQYVRMVIGNLTTVVNEIYKKGGRKFGFLSLVDLSFLPSVRALEHTNSLVGFKEQALVLVKLHNKALSKMLMELKKQLKGFKYSNSNMNSSTSERINSPSKYGFKEGKVACCGYGPYRGMGRCGAIKEYELCDNPGDYLFFDGGHPTEKFNKQLAMLMWNGSPQVTSPHNLKLLVDEE